MLTGSRGEQSEKTSWILTESEAELVKYVFTGWKEHIVSKVVVYWLQGLMFDNTAGLVLRRVHKQTHINLQTQKSKSHKDLYM